MNQSEMDSILKGIKKLSNDKIEDTLIDISKQIINLSNYQTIYIEELKRRKYANKN